MATTLDTRERIIVPGPAGFHPPSAAQLGVALPDPGQGLYYGLLELNEDKVIEEMARKMLTSPNATIATRPVRPITPPLHDLRWHTDREAHRENQGRPQKIRRAPAQTYCQVGRPC